MDIKKKQELGNKVFKAVMKEINRIKKFNKEHINTKYFQPQTMVADLNIGMKHGWVGAKDDCYQIKVGRNWDAPVVADKLTSLYDLKEVIGEVEKHINEQRKVKGWANLNVAYDSAWFGSGYYQNEVKYPSKITLCEKPCKEFTSLKNYINKYGKGKYGSVNLSDYELFNSAMGGKRGRLWDEYGDRCYLANKPKKCALYLEQLRNQRGTKDIMLCERGHEDYIDPIDQRYSEMHEVECDGEKRHYLQITIKTPTGRVKYEAKLY
jgi:hypothetical protein